MPPWVIAVRCLRDDGPNIRQAFASFSPACFKKRGPLFCLILIGFGSLSTPFVGFIIVRLVSSVSGMCPWRVLLLGVVFIFRSPVTELTVTGCIFVLSGSFPMFGNTLWILCVSFLCNVMVFCPLRAI